MLYQLENFVTSIYISARKRSCSLYLTSGLNKAENKVYRWCLNNLCSPSSIKYYPLPAIARNVWKNLVIYPNSSLYLIFISKWESVLLLLQEKTDSDKVIVEYIESQKTAQPTFWTSQVSPPLQEIRYLKDISIVGSLWHFFNLLAIYHFLTFGCS